MQNRVVAILCICLTLAACTYPSRPVNTEDIPAELADSLAAAKGDMDPEDLKMLKIKHRCKEVKEMTKADSEYLKAVFEHMEKAKSAGNIISQGNLGGFVKMNTTTGAFGDIMSINQVSVGSMEGGQPSTIDIAL